MSKSGCVFDFTGPDRGPFAGCRWTFRRGEQWAVMGPNGSGKSYLAALLAGELPLCGADVRFGDGIDGHVAVVTFSQQQEQASSGWLQERWHWQESGDDRPVRAFLGYESVNEINPFEVRGDESAERRAFARRLAWVSDLFGLSPLFGRQMPQLSNGEMRRVLLARALLRAPRLLVLDDPFAGLDPAMRARLQEALGRLAAENLPMVLMARHADEIPPCFTHLLTLGNLKVARKSRLAGRAEYESSLARKPVGEMRTGRSLSARQIAREPVVELRGVTVRYGRRTVLDGLDWTVRAGERWQVIGPNGSGKTTLLSLITGDNPAAYANDVKVFGRGRVPGESLWPIRRRIGQVSPEIQCYFDGSMACLDAVLSGRFNAEGGILRATPAAREAARAWLGELGLSEAERAPFGTLSSGRQRLVLLARALLPQPDLLLLDEPCLNLDDASRRHVLSVLERLFRKRREEAVVCVAHRPDDVPRGFDRVLRL